MTAMRRFPRNRFRTCSPSWTWWRLAHIGEQLSAPFYWPCLNPIPDLGAIPDRLKPSALDTAHAFDIGGNSSLRNWSRSKRVLDKRRSATWLGLLSTRNSYRYFLAI